MARPLHCRGGRPPVPIEQRPVSQSVRLSPATADRVCRLALRRGVSVYSLLGAIVERVFAQQRIPPAQPACYGVAEPPSTLGSVLGESPSKRAHRDVDPSSPR